MAGSEGLRDDGTIEEMGQVIVELVDERQRDSREVRPNPAELGGSKASRETANERIRGTGNAAGILDVRPDGLNDFRRNLRAVVVDDADFIEDVHDERFLVVVSEVGGVQTARLIPLTGESSNGDLLAVDAGVRPEDEEGEDAEVLLQKNGLNDAHEGSPNKGVSGNQRHDLA